MSKEKTYFFVDESGDPIFFNKKGECLLEQGVCSPILILGFIKTYDPKPLRKAISLLHQEIEKDEYLKSIPSIVKTNKSFHAKDDVPEVREKVFKLLKILDFKAEIIVARKRLDVFNKKHKKDEDNFYFDIVSHLFRRKLHLNDNVIYFSKRGSSNKQIHLSKALHNAVKNFEAKYGTRESKNTDIFVQIPSEEPCLQIVDYINWIIYRAYTKNEMRYFDYLKDKFSLIVDLYDFEKYGKKESNWYNRSNLFDIKKISPL